MSDMLPPEAMQHPMATMFMTFMREAKKDIRRMPPHYIEPLARILGQAFVWVADGEIDDPPDNDDEMQELLANV